MNYKYARTLENRKRNTFWAGLVLAMMLVAGCSLVVAGLVDYGFHVATDAALEITKEVLKEYVPPPPGVGTYTPGPDLYEQIHREWKRKLISTIAHDAWDYRVDFIKLSALMGGMGIALDDAEKLCRWTI